MNNKILTIILISVQTSTPRTFKVPPSFIATWTITKQSYKV